mgnify:CR=1 FL=1
MTAVFRHAKLHRDGRAISRDDAHPPPELTPSVGVRCGLARPKVPTADLEDERPGIPDEQVHGVSYEDIDAFLQEKPVSEAAYHTIVQTYDRSQHKRELPKAP